jgi:glycosyltransferase involved in cell wall biosynthesis
MTRLDSDAAPDDRPVVTVVAPAFNEVETLRAFRERVAAALAGESYELIVVDDGSTDGTARLLDQMAAEDPRIWPLHLSRNFGHQAAVTAGIDHARGAVVVTIDADLQDPPEAIPVLLERWRGGADVVHAVRHVRPGERRLRLLAIRQFYRLFSRLARLESFPGNAGDFRLIGGPALTALRAMPERNRFVRGLVAWVGFRQESVVYEREARYAGNSKYPLRKLLQLATDGLVSFSTAPLRMAAGLGVFFSLAAFAAIPVVIILRLLDLYRVSGIASVHILVLLIGGIQLMSLGVIGEYLGRTYDEGKRRPIYLVAPNSESDDRSPSERAHGD